MPSSWSRILAFPLGIIFLCLTGDTASGSCGDYLHTRFGPPAMPQHQSSPSRESNDVLNLEATHFSDDSFDQEQPWPVFIADKQSDGKPCSGPGCRSNQQRFPTPNAPVPTELSVPAKAVQSTQASDRNTDSDFGLPIAEPLDLAAGHANRVERPPRRIGSTVG